MRLNLIFGFLGSGKTTLVRRILTERAGGQRTAVIVNEFGDVSIDGDILQGDSIDMVQLNSGCLCCTLKGELISAITELKDRADIERTIVEASGVAVTGDLLEDIWDPQLSADVDIDLGPVVTVVDGPMFRKIREALGDFYTEQVAYADVVLLNKIDNADVLTLDAVQYDIATLNPAANIIFTEQCSADLDIVLDGKSAQSAAGLGHGGHSNDNGHDHEHGHVQFNSFVLDFDVDVRRETLEKFFHDLDTQVYRAKGFMTIDGQSRLVQFATGQLDIHPVDNPCNHRMVFIGQGLDRHRLQEKFDFACGGESEG
jgi:G3E family GTPase